MQIAQRVCIFSLFPLLFISACGQLPIQEMSDARQVISAAYAANADHYVSEQMNYAEQQLHQAEYFLAKKSLEKARAHAVMAKKHALQAHHAAAALNRAVTSLDKLKVLQGKNEGQNKSMGLYQQALNAVKKGDLSETIYLADETYRQAEAALNELYLQRAQQLSDRVKQQNSHYSADGTLLKRAQQAQQKREGKKAFELFNILINTEN